MNDLNRDFNGKIQTYNASLDFWYPYKPLKFLEKNINYYFEKLDQHISKKLVHVIPYRWNLNLVWPEQPLVDWFLNNYKSLGFDDAVLEKTEEYYELKKQMCFNKFPDLLILKDNEWLRLEVENWAHRYFYCHGSGYADLVLAYDAYYHSYYSDVPLITLKEYFKVKNIINLSEVYHYLYLFDKEFRNDYSNASNELFADRLGISIPL